MNTETALLIAVGLAMVMMAMVYALVSGGIDQAEASIFGSEEGDNGLLDRGKDLDEESDMDFTSGKIVKREESVRAV